MARNLLVLVLALAAAACGDAGTPGRLRVATEAQYRPFEYVEKDGTLTGFDVELFRAIAREEGLEVEFVNQPFTGLIPGVQGGKYDAAVSAITITPERAGAVAFSDPYYDAGLVLVVREDTEGIAGLEDLRGRTIAVQLNTTGHLKAREVEGAEIRTYDSVEPAFMELLEGRADAVVNDEPPTRHYMKRHDGLKVVGGLLTKEQYGIVVRKDNRELLEAINRGLGKVRASGEYERLRKTWITGE